MIGWRACRGLNVSDNALMTGRFSLGTGDACLRGIAFGYGPVRLKLRLAEKVARCNWRSNQPEDLTLIHGRGVKRNK